MATRRVRRDSETSTDSWSLVEEDHLSDDISVDSTEEESDDDQEEPIIEEPPTSDDDTASEDSESEKSDSDCDSDSDSDCDSDSEVEKENSEVSEVSEDDDSDLEIQEEEEILKEEEEEEEEEMSEEEKEAVRKCKEEDWYNEEEEYDQEDEVNRIHPIPLAIALAFMFGFFVAADRYTSYLIKKEVDGPLGAFGDYSQQSYNSKRFGKFGFRRIDPEPVRYDYRGRPLEPLSKQLKKLSDNVHTDFPKTFKFFDTSPILEPMNLTGILPFNFQNETIKLPSKWLNIWRIDREIPELMSGMTFSLAPVPPAPFTPRRTQKPWGVPKYQPCLVHVNESKWTCQKNVPAVYYSQSHLIKKWKKSGRTGGGVETKKKNKQICAKKASESMRTISKPTDQCESRHFSKYTPRRKHIAYKAPLPCKAPNYKPSQPKPTQKPSSSEDWFSKRSQVRAQLRSRA